MFSSHPADADDDDTDEGEGDDADDHDTGDCEKEKIHTQQWAQRPGSHQLDSTSMFLSQFDFDENAYDANADDADDQPARPSAQRLEQPVLSHFAESWPSVT